MKLFTKLFLQIAAAFLVLSQVIFFYILYQSQEQNLRNIEEYEHRYVLERTRDFDRRMRNSNVKMESEQIQKLVAVNMFRESFGSKGILYSETGEELYNGTPYEFDLEGLKQYMSGDEAQGVRYEYITLKQESRRFLVFNPTQIGAYLNYQIIYFKDVTELYDRTEELFLDGLLFSFGALILIGGILLQGIHRTIRPLVELKKAAASIAEGAYGSRLSVKGADEIREVALSFNQMAARVEEHVEKLSAINETQRQLLGSLAHELKTPMTAIIGYADTLLTVRLSDRRREQALNYIGNECRRLSRLSVKMMELTGLYETGERSLEKRAENVNDFLKRLKDLTSYRLKEKEIHLEIICEPDSLEKEMDPDLMMSLLMNLVDNAYKASPPGSAIRVTADAGGFAVEDFGTGIPRDEVSRVTEAFYMVDKSRSRSAGSVGLGLALCRQIADMHGAELVIETEEGKGTRVSVLWR